MQVIPGAAGALQSRIDSETTAAVAGAFPAALNEGAMLRIPAESAPYDEILARMRGFQQHEPNPRKGRVFGYMYEVMDHDLESFIQKAFVMSATTEHTRGSTASALLRALSSHSFTVCPVVLQVYARERIESHGLSRASQVRSRSGADDAQPVQCARWRCGLVTALF